MRSDIIVHVHVVMWKRMLEYNAIRAFILCASLRVTKPFACSHLMSTLATRVAACLCVEQMLGKCMRDIGTAFNFQHSAGMRQNSTKIHVSRRSIIFGIEMNKIRRSKTRKNIEINHMRH